MYEKKKIIFIIKLIDIQIGTQYQIKILILPL
jgi:hypothetical protein